jgi:type VII secretion protein EccE
MPIPQRPAQPAAPVAPPAPKGPRRAFRWILPVRLWQLVAWELAALAVAFTLGRPAPLQLAGAVVAGLLFVSTSVRIGGYCLWQWEPVLVRYWQRRRLATMHRTAEPLSALVPDLKLRQHVDRGGNRVGLAIYGDGLTAVVRLEATTRPDSGALLESLKDAFASTTIPLVRAQLVVWTAAMPLQAGRRYADATPEPMRLYWLALRYGPGQAPQASEARGGGEIGAMRAVASAAVSLAVRLDDAGYASTVLDRDSLSQELVVALGANAGAASASAVGLRETWRTWFAAGIRQACYLPDRSLDPAELLGSWAPWAAFSCVSYTLRRTVRGEVRGEVVARLGATGTRTPEPGSAFGRHPVPTTGRHQKYVLRTLPLAIDV